MLKRTSSLTPMVILGSLLALAHTVANTNPAKGFFGSAEITPTVDGARTVVTFTPKDGELAAYVLQYALTHHFCYPARPVAS